MCRKGDGAIIAGEGHDEVLEPGLGEVEAEALVTAAAAINAVLSITIN